MLSVAWLSYIHRKHKASFISYGAVIVAFVLFGWRMFAFIMNYTNPLPYSDHWSIARFFIDHIPLSSIILLTQNAHHVGMGLLLNVFLITFSRWNTLYETLCIGLLLVIAAVIALLVKKKIVGTIETTDVIIPFIFFHLYQWENLTLGFNISFIFPLVFLCLLAYVRLFFKSFTRDVAIILIALGSVYSGIHGLVVGCFAYCSFVYDAMKSSRPRMIIRYSVLLIVVALICFSYGWTIPSWYHFAPSHFLSPISVSVDSALNFFSLFMSILLGMHQESYAVYSIPLLLCVVLWMVCHSSWFKTHSSETISLGFFFLYSLVFMAMTYIARGGDGIIVAETPRYSTHMIPLYFFLYVVLRVLANLYKQVRWVIAGLLVIFMVVSFTSSGKDPEMKKTYISLQAWKSCYLIHSDIQFCDAATQFSIAPNIKQSDLQSYMNMLKEKKWNIYR